jgi:WD40 repeat protein
MDRLLLTSLALLALSPLAPAAPPAEKAEARTDRYGDPLPEGAVARLGTLRLSHRDEISSAAFSPDGRTIATAGGDILLWDLKKGKQLRRLTEPTAYFRQVAFLPDGKTLIAADCGADAVFCWDVATGRRLLHIGGRPSGELSMIQNRGGSLPMSPDGKVVATTVGGLHLWDTTTGKQVRELEPRRHRLVGFTAALSPDGKAIALGSSGRLRVWDLTADKPPRVLSENRDGFLCLAFSPDGTVLASGGRGIRLWNLRTGEPVRKEFGPREPVESLVFTADGKGLVSAGVDGVSLWDAESGKEARCFIKPGRSFVSLSLSPDGKVLAATGWARLRLWEVATGRELLPFDGHHNRVQSVSFSPDRQSLVSCADGIILWGLRDRTILRRLGDEAVSIHTASYGGDGRRLACSGWDDVAEVERVRLYEVGTGKELGKVDIPERLISSIVFRPDAGSFVCVHRDGSTRLWDFSTGKPLRELGESRDHPVAVHSAYAMSPDGTRVLLGDVHEGLHLLQLAGGGRVPLDGSVWRRDVAFSPDGTTVAGGRGPTLWDARTGRVIRRLAGPDLEPMAVSYSPDARMLASAAVNGDIRLLEVATGKERRRFRCGLGPDAWATCLAFSPDGRLMASAGHDTAVLLWAVTGLPEASDARPAALSDKELATVWGSIADTDASRSYEAMCQLISSPAQAVPFIKDRLSPAPDTNSKKIAQLVKDLDAEEFDVREKASRDLAKYAEAAETALKTFLNGKPSAEARRRAEELLAQLKRAEPRGEDLRALRAVEVLEHIGTPEASRVLDGLAQGAPEARLTRDARASLDRLGRRPRRP